MHLLNSKSHVHFIIRLFPWFTEIAGLLIPYCIGKVGLIIVFFKAVDLSSLWCRRTAQSRNQLQNVTNITGAKFFPDIIALFCSVTKTMIKTPWINAQCRSKFWHWSQCRSIPINSDQLRGIDTSQCWTFSIDADWSAFWSITHFWSVLIGIDRHWAMIQEVLPTELSCQPLKRWHFYFHILKCTIFNYTFLTGSSKL